MAPGTVSDGDTTKRILRRMKNYTASFEVCSNATSSTPVPQQDGTTTAAYCCFSSTTCQPDGTCALKDLPDGDIAAKKIMQIPCPIDNAPSETINSSTVRDGKSINGTVSGNSTSSWQSAASSTTSSSFSFPTSKPSLTSDLDQSEGPAMPLIFTYPLLILAFIIMVLGGLYFFYRRQNRAATIESEMAEAYHDESGSRPPRRRRVRRGWFGHEPLVVEEEEEMNCNDSTVDLELPSYQQHAWTSRWATLGRSRRPGEAGEIVEVVNLRGEHGENVPVAIVRDSGCLASSHEESAMREKRARRWVGEVRRWRSRRRGSGGPSTASTRDVEGEWSVEPPAYAEAESSRDAISVTKPELTAVR